MPPLWLLLDYSIHERKNTFTIDKGSPPAGTTFSIRLKSVTAPFRPDSYSPPVQAVMRSERHHKAPPEALRPSSEIVQRCKKSSAVGSRTFAHFLPHLQRFGNHRLHIRKTSGAGRVLDRTLMAGVGSGMALNILQIAAALFDGNMVNDFFLGDILAIANKAHLIHPPSVFRTDGARPLNSLSPHCLPCLSFRSSPRAYKEWLRRKATAREAGSDPALREPCACQALS